MNSHSIIKKLYSLLLALSIAFPAPGMAAAAPASPAQIRGFDLLAPGAGWVLLDNRLFWTSDSGAAWKEIGPSLPTGAEVQTVDLLDPNTGRVLWSTLQADGTASFTLAQTEDQGATWTDAPLPLFDPGEAAAQAEKADMGWLDPHTGWIAVQQASGSNFSLGTLFTTSDGGTTWRRSALPVAEQVVFSDSLTGWAFGGPTGDQVYRTQDGGITWQDARPGLPADSPAIAYPPASNGGTDTLVMTTRDTEAILSLHVFRGGNETGQVKVEAQAGTIALSMIDAKNFSAVIPGTDTIVRLREGLLEKITSQDGLSASITGLDMLTLDSGWAKSTVSNCKTTPASTEGSATVSCSSQRRLLRTEDGGLTWQEIPLPLSPSEAAASFESSSSVTVNVLPNLGNTAIFTGQGFDKCEIPTTAQMQAWKNSSPYGAVNLYIGGSSRACSNAALSSVYLMHLHHQGWKFIPTWVGPQAPCTGFNSRMSSDVTTAYTQGVSEANLAVDRLAQLGLTLPDKTGSVVYYDIEYYGTDAACRAAVNSFMNGWVAQLHARGNLAGIYGSTLCNTGLSDFQALANIPDVVWPARWYHSSGQGFYDPSATVWDLGACIPNTMWSDHQRIRQYEGDHNETWGGLTLGIDSDVLDGVVAVPTLEPAAVLFQEVASGLSNPVLITNAGDGSGRLFIIERSGRIRLMKNGVLQTTPFLDIQALVRSTSAEQGLLALAFHPSYESNGKFYVVYTAPRGGDSVGSVLTLRQYTVSADPDIADPGSGSTLLTIDHPTYSNHNGGTLAFGNDGYLYWSTGDGGGGGDIFNNAQNLGSLLGKVLRLDVDSGSPYSIPPTNPFFGSPNPNVKKEIWAYGLRNPWRISFDRLTHDLLIGDVGQASLEEIDFQPASSGGGENYGWNIMEGSQCYPSSSNCDRTGKVLPVAEYDHGLGCSVTGGYVYRGSTYPSLKGYYLYGDYCSGRIFGIYQNSPLTWSTPVQLADTAYSITTFGEDEQGELYVADYNTGKIYQIQYQEPYVTLKGNAGLAGVTLSYIDETPKTVSSDSSGNYSITVPAGWSGTVTPTRTGFTFSPAARSYSNLISDLGNQNYTPVWVGGVTITSNRNVVAVARPHVGDEVASYAGFPSGSLSVYLPMLFKGAFGGAYNSAFYLQNINAANSANVTIKYYDSSGALNCTKTDTIAPLASRGYWVPSETCDSGSLPSGWVGGVLVNSDQPIAAVGRPHIGAEVLTYDGFSAGSLTSYIPMLFKGAFGGSYNSAFYLQNTHGSNPASVTIKYYDSTGTLNCTKADIIPPLASRGYWVPSETCDSGSLPDGWVGGVVVTSDQPIVGVGRPHIGAQITSYNGASSGGLTAHVPMLFKGAFGGSYNSAFYLQNSHASNPATVTIKYYDSTGTLNCTKTDTIAPLASRGYWVPSETCDSGSLPPGWVGGVIVTSNQPLVSVGRPHVGPQVTTYNGFTGGGLNFNLPMLFRAAFGGSYNAAFYVQNTEASPASITIKYYDSSGVLSCTRTATIPALSTLGYWTPAETCPP